MSTKPDIVAAAIARLKRMWTCPVCLTDHAENACDTCGRRLTAADLSPEPRRLPPLAHKEGTSSPFAYVCPECFSASAEPFRCGGPHAVPGKKRREYVFVDAVPVSRDPDCATEPASQATPKPASDPATDTAASGTPATRAPLTADRSE